jgi:hypothetical protein
MRGPDLGGRVLVQRQPFLLISITTSAWSVPSFGLIDLTLPTWTPAIRTGELTRRPLEDSNTALRRKPCVKGMSLVKPSQTAMSTIASAISPTVRGLRPERRRREATAITSRPPSVGCLPGHVADHLAVGQPRLVARLALLRLARRARVRVRVECR